jgi:hypothetical protein
MCRFISSVFESLIGLSKPQSPILQERKIKLANSYLLSTQYAGCFKKNFTLVFQMLLRGECYEKGLNLKTYKLSIVTTRFHLQSLF